MTTKSVKLNFPEIEASLKILNIDEETVVYYHNSQILFKDDVIDDCVIYATPNSLFVNRLPIDLRLLFSKGKKNKRIPNEHLCKWYRGTCSRFQLGGYGIKVDQPKRIKLRLADHMHIRISMSDSSDYQVASNMNYIWIKSPGNVLIYDKNTLQMTLNDYHIDNLKINRSSANFLISTWHVKWREFLRFLNSKAKAEKPPFRSLYPIGSIGIYFPIQIEGMRANNFAQQFDQSYSFIDSPNGHSLVQLGDVLYCDGLPIHFLLPSSDRLRTIRLVKDFPFFRFLDFQYRDLEYSAESSSSSDIVRLEDSLESDDSEQELPIVFVINFGSPPKMKLKSQMDQKEEEEEEKEEPKNRCSICLDRELAYAAIPCAHLCCCDQCYLPLRQCPICKADIDKFMRIFIA